MYLEILSYIQNKNERISDLREIFFLTAKRQVQSAEDREHLFSQYAEPYLKFWPDDVFFVCDLQTKRTMGYLLGCRNSQKAEEILSPRLKSYMLFSDFFKKYPAHLHMNIHPDFQGHGAGTFVLQEYLIELRDRVRGAHIVTAENEPNVEFYRRNKFDAKDMRTFLNLNLLLMARSV